MERKLAYKLVEIYETVQIEVDFLYRRKECETLQF